MIKKLLALVAVGMMAGCVETNIKRVISDDGAEFKIYEIDSCEYVCHIAGGSIAHKGNCKNLIHKK